MASFTQNLRLRIDDTLSASARYNLERIDTLASTFIVDSTGELDIRSRGDIHIQPESPDIGGGGSGGILRLGTSASQRAAEINLFADQVYSPVSTVLDGEISGTAVLDEDNMISNSDVQVATQQSIKTYVDNSLAGFTATLPENRIDVGNAISARQQVDTNSVGDILADPVLGLLYKPGSIADADVAGAAAISQSKLALAITDAEVAAGAAVAQSKLALAITDSEVDAAAGIAQSKLDLAITDSEVDAAAGIAQSKLALAVTDSEVAAGANIAQSKIAGLAADLSGKLEIASNLGDVASAGTSRTNLGVASYATDWVTGDGTSKSVSHNLGNADILLAIYDKGDGRQVYVDEVTRISANVVSLVSSQAPGASGWRVLVQEVAGA